jgi:hypothetical protein
VGEHFDSPCPQATRVALVGGFDAGAFPDVAEAALLVADDDDCLRVTTSASDRRPNAPEETRMIPDSGATALTQPVT